LNAGELQRPLHDRDVRVEPFRGEQRPARRAGDAHDAAHADVLLRDELGEALQLFALSRVLRSAEVGEGLRLPGRDACEHFRHEAAARVRHKVNLGIVWQCFRERDRIGDRADPERRVIERVDAVAVCLKERGHQLRMLCPELAKRAAGIGERAVDEHERRVGRGRHGGRWLTLERGQAVLTKLVDACRHARIEPLPDFRRREISRRVFGNAGNRFDRPHEHVAEKPTRRTARRRRLLEAPLQAHRHAHFTVRNCLVRRAARACGILLRHQQVAGILGVQVQ
jgi:hypothetical protein